MEVEVPRTIRNEPASFRDRNGSVFYSDDAVLRGLSRQGLDDWEMLSTKEFFYRSVAEGKIVRTRRVHVAEIEELAESRGWAGILAHDSIPFVSYPYEWSFGMLKDAALLQLELLISALEEGMVLKDASAFNVQWQGVSSVFIDIPSFQRLSAGEVWTGYRQFCQMFLYPLFLVAYKDVPFQPWLRGRIDGIEVEDCDRLMSLRDLFRPGVFTHVYLQAKMQARYAKPRSDVGKDLRAAGFNKELIKANVRGLLKLVRGLSWKRSKSEWSHYSDDNSYTDVDRVRKQEFVRDAVRSRHWNLVWDLGCNTGVFARIAQENARSVVAMDADHLAIERFYQALKSEGTTSILPLVNNLADPSPCLGWRLLERKNLNERGRPDLTLCLALIHHLVLSANVPLQEVIRWLARLGSDVVVEFVTREDRMVKALLRNKLDNYVDYNLDNFEQTLDTFFQVQKRQILSSGTRILYFATNTGRLH